MNDFELCKSMISPIKILEFHNIQIKNKRCRCFIHNGKDFNMSVCENFVKCFVCGETADIFKIEMLLGGQKNKFEALRAINFNFNLGLNFGEKKPKIIIPIYTLCKDNNLEKDVQAVLAALIWQYFDYKNDRAKGAEDYALILQLFYKSVSDNQKIELLKKYEKHIENAFIRRDFDYERRKFSGVWGCETPEKFEEYYMKHFTQETLEYVLKKHNFTTIKELYYGTIRETKSRIYNINTDSHLYPKIFSVSYAGRAD
jgi:hypothetical protein